MAAHAAVAAAVAVAYAGLAFRVDNLFPFSSFAMYSSPSEVQTRVVVRLEDGDLEELRAFARFSCPGLDALRVAGAASRRCPAAAPRWDVDQDGKGAAGAWIEARPGAPWEGEPVEIVLRTYTFAAARQVVAVQDCVLLECRAVRRVRAGGR